MNARRWVSLGFTAAVLALTLAASPTAQSATRYVDGLWGNNAYDGLSAVVDHGHGPKRNVSAAISAAPNQATIIIASGFYQELVWDPGTKRLTLVPQDKATIYDTEPFQTDTDGDQMSDGWEQLYGLQPFNPGDAILDADGDGETNVEEFSAGTDPTDADSALRIVAIEREGNDIRVTWTCVGGKSYALQTNAFTIADFADLTAAIDVPNGYTEPTTNCLHTGGGLSSQRLYRVRVLP